MFLAYKDVLAKMDSMNQQEVNQYLVGLLGRMEKALCSKNDQRGLSGEGCLNG